jgi:hypothetical protein
LPLAVDLRPPSLPDPKLGDEKFVGGDEGRGEERAEDHPDEPEEREVPKRPIIIRTGWIATRFPIIFGQK